MNEREIGWLKNLWKIVSFCWKRGGTLDDVVDREGGSLSERGRERIKGRESTREVRKRENL